MRDAAYANYERVPNGFAPPPTGGGTQTRPARGGGRVISDLTREGRWGGASLTGKRPPHGDPATGAREGGRRPVRGSYKTSSIEIYSIKSFNFSDKNGKLGL